MDLVPNAITSLVDVPWHAVILGTGDLHLEQQIRTLGQKFPQVRTVLRYDSKLARSAAVGDERELFMAKERQRITGVV